MKRKFRVLITLLTAAITFGSLFAFAGNKGISNWHNKHCNGVSWHSSLHQHEKQQTEAAIDTSR